MAGGFDDAISVSGARYAGLPGRLENPEKKENYCFTQLTSNNFPTQFESLRSEDRKVYEGAEMRHWAEERGKIEVSQLWREMIGSTQRVFVNF